MKIAIVGSSGHHHQLLEAMKERSDLDVVALAPGCPQEDMRGLCTRLPEAKFFEDWRTMLDAVKPDCAVINPWYCYNPTVSEECLTRGIHAYSEKPLATEWDALLSLKRTWEQGKADLGAMFNLRYCAWFTTVRELVGAGEIGEVRMLHGQKSYKMGVRPSYYNDRKLYGGILPWVGIHAMDWVLQLGGKPVSVRAIQNMHCNNGQGELETAGFMLAELENGVIGTVSADYFRPDGSARHDDDRIRVTGTKGMIEAFDGRVFLENDKPKREIALLPGKNAFLAFADAIGTEEARRQAFDALAVTRLALAARDAGDSGNTVSLSGNW